MATTGHENETVTVAGLKATVRKGGNKGLFNECICSTAGGTAAKVTNTVPASFSLVSGAKIIVKFTYAISVADATLKVGDADAKPIYYRGAALGANMVKAGDKLFLSYNGSQFDIIGSLGETYESKQAASGGTDLSLVTTGEKYAWNDKISSSAKGAANGVASLDNNGKVPASQLPSYVDDVIEGYYKKADGKFYKESTYTTEITGESGKIYTDLSTDTTYRWSGTKFTQIKGDLAIGTTTGTAADGGIVNTHVNDNDIHVTLQDKSNWSGKQDALEFNTAYDATTNKVATMADVPDAQIQSDWNQTTSTAKDYIKNKPNLATVATSGSYNDLSNKPTIPTIEDFHEAVATLSATPTSSTLTYTRDGVTYNYKIGDEVRVADQEAEEGYKFYKLYDITGTAPNQEAVWGGLGSGGGSVATKSYSVIISSNQSDTTDIANARVNYGGLPYASGATIDVPTSITITAADLSASSITGYSIDIQVTGLVIMVTYSTEILTVTITATDEVSGVSSCSVTVTDGNSTTLGTLTNGQSLKIPYGVNYVCTPSTPSVGGYTKPAAVTKNWSDTAAKALTFTYEYNLVDLGLSVKWAKGNICKDTNDNYYIGESTETGCFYSWGNIIGHIQYDGYNFVTDYENTPGYSLTASIASNDSAHDAALACLGTGYRMPTKAEFDELISNCTFTWTSNYNNSGVAGGILTSKVSGYTDKSIFFRGDGFFSIGYKDWTYVGTALRLWSSTYVPASSMSSRFALNSDGSINNNLAETNMGMQVRAVV